MICADPREDEEENLVLPAAAITTLQQSAKFKNLFDQLGLTAKERKIATKALVSIASGAGVECLSAEMPEDRALLQESTEITFSSEDMEVGHPEEASLFSSIYKSNLHQGGPGRYRCFRKPHSIEHPASRRNFREKDPRMPDGSNEIRWKRRVHRRSHSVIVESRSYSLFSSFPRGQNESILPCAFGKTLVTQTPTSLVHLPPMCERKIEW